jgi:hypothetical protein
MRDSPVGRTRSWGEYSHVERALRCELVPTNSTALETLSRAALLIVVPPRVDTTMSYSPESAVLRLKIRRISLVAPAIAAPLRRHCSVAKSLPDTVATNPASVPM